ncbi:palmitoyltransferase ZDHHC21 isoform 2-T4 [Geothlypis trichas]
MGLRIHFVVDPQGWCCMGLIIFVWLYNTIFIPKVILFPHYEEGNISVVAVLCYYFCSLFCIASLFRASVADPGKLPENPEIPITERGHWELCNKCNVMRPKRSHHCSRCGHCVRRMDHHCPWINNCVGEDNHWLFLQLCFYTQILSSYTLILDFCHYYYFLPLKKENWRQSGLFMHQSQNIVRTVETRDATSSLIQTECQRNVVLRHIIKPFQLCFSQSHIEHKHIDNTSIQSLEVHVSLVKTIAAYFQTQ